MMVGTTETLTLSNGREGEKEIASNQSNLFFNVRMSFTPKKTSSGSIKTGFKPVS